MDSAMKGQYLPLIHKPVFLEIQNKMEKIFVKIKSIKNFVAFSILLVSAFLFSACGGGETKNTNAANSNSSVKSNTSNQNTTSSAPVSDKPPATIEAGNITTSELIDLQGSPGRMVTADGNLVLVKEGEKELNLSHAKAPSSGTPFNEVACKGDFSKYTGIREKIADATKKLSPPRATVKGTVAKEQDQEGVLILEPCVLADLKANP